MKLGRHRVYRCDSTKGGVIEGVLSRTPDAVLTDCPYNVSNKKSGGLRETSYGEWDYGTGLFATLRLLAKLHEVPNWICFCGDLQLSPLLEAMKAQRRQTRTGCWAKTNPSPRNGQHGPVSAIEVAAFGRRPKAFWAGHCQGLVWKGNAPRGKRWRLHKTQKPLALFISWLRLICPEGGLVLDPYLGSGTTVLAAEYLGMTVVGFDIESENIEHVKTRWGRRDEEFEKLEKEMARCT